LNGAWNYSHAKELVDGPQPNLTKFFYLALVHSMMKQFCAYLLGPFPVAPLAGHYPTMNGWRCRKRSVSYNNNIEMGICQVQVSQTTIIQARIAPLSPSPMMHPQHNVALRRETGNLLKKKKLDQKGTISVG
jgi:hypothetical protein